MSWTEQEYRDFWLHWLETALIAWSIGVIAFVGGVVVVVLKLGQILEAVKAMKP